MAQPMHVLTSLDKISIILFWEILKKHNPFLLDKDFGEEKKYTEEEKEYIIDVWEKVYDDFYKLRNDGKSKIILQKNHEKMMLLFKMTLLSETLSFLVEVEKVKNSLDAESYAVFIQKIKVLFEKIEPKIKFNVFDLEKSSKIVVQFIQSYETAYKMKHKKEEKEVEKEVENVYRIVAQVEQVLERSIPNINEISVMQWLAYEEIATEKIKKAKEIKSNGKK